VRVSQKFFLVIVFWAVLVVLWLTGRNDTDKAFDYLQAMKIERVELRSKFKSITDPPDRSSSSGKLLTLINTCLEGIEAIHDFRYQRELTWKKVAFIGKEQEHHIGYAVLDNENVLLGSYYEVVFPDGTTKHVGMGSGMISTCLGTLISQI
jgi:hypothetical protein